MLGAFLYKISSKLKKLKTNFEDKTRYIIKLSKSELINSASEGENNETEESWTSNDEYLSDFSKLQLQMYELCVSRDSMKESFQGKKSSDLEEDSSRIEILSGVLMVSTNQWLHRTMQKAFANWIKMKLLKVILKVYF